MDFRFNDEQEMFRAAIRGELDRAFGALTTAALLEGAAAHGARLWQIATEQGWLALMVPEADGGLGLGAVGAVLLHEELGRIGPAAPIDSSGALLAGLRRAGILADAIGEILPGITAGSAQVALARPAPAAAGPGWVVEFPDTATHVLLLGESVALVERAALGALTAHAAFDLTQPIAVAHDFAAPQGEAVSPAALGAAHLAHAAELIGLAERALQRSIAYARERIQFDKPIGSFQAIKHKLADAFVRIENARTATYYAAWAWDQDATAAVAAVDMARATAGEMGWRVVADCIQVHGGMGFTWEAGLHIALRRSKRLAMMLGTAAEARRRIAVELFG